MQKPGDGQRRGPARRALVAVALTIAVVGAIGLTSRGSGIFDRAQAAYAEWSLRSRVTALWKVRMTGDLDKTAGFVIQSSEPRAQIGNAVLYESFHIREVKIDQAGVAQVKVRVAYKIGIPGFTEKSAPAAQIELNQRWVREGRTWYWDPGPPPGSINPVRVEPGTKQENLSKEPPSSPPERRDQAGR